MDSVVLITVRNDRCSMQFLVDVKLTGDGGRVSLRSLYTKHGDD